MFVESVNALSWFIPFVVLSVIAALVYAGLARDHRRGAMCVCILTAHAKGRSEEDQIPAEQVHRMAELAERFGWGIDGETHKYFRFTNHKFWFIPASQYLADKNAREFKRVQSAVDASELPVVVLITCAKNYRMNSDGTPRNGRTFRSRSDNDL